MAAISPTCACRPWSMSGMLSRRSPGAAQERQFAHYGHSHPQGGRTVAQGARRHPAAVWRGGIRVFEDAKRLERNFPQEMQKAYEMAGAQPDDLLVLVAGSQQPGGPSHGEHCGPGRGPARSAGLYRGGRCGLRWRRSMPTGTACSSGDRKDALLLHVGNGLSHVRVEPGRAPLGSRAPSLHIASRRGHGKAFRGSGSGGSMIRR